MFTLYVTMAGSQMSPKGIHELHGPFSAKEEAAQHCMQEWGENRNDWPLVSLLPYVEGQTVDQAREAYTALAKADRYTEMEVPS